ncbi:DUF6065 family protein [Streptomyces virginiae]|uniref:DUF6065 family protein n=1 Tax=Streptomyces virginiae TaxID=1961 RepID=UPI000AAB1EBC|nr:DUF6065 family protein [Streptomyces virginiae]
MVEFSFRACFQGVVAPTRADPTLMGAASFRAAVHCQPFREATSHCWYTYPPMSCFLKWDGGAFHWLPHGQDSWLPISSEVTGRMLYHVQGRTINKDPLLSLPILAAAPEAGILQVWTGLIAQSPPGWSLLTRGVPNWPGEIVYEVLEGIVETDWWHGPVLANLRFRKTDEVVRLNPKIPLYAIQPLQRSAYQIDHHLQFHPANADAIDQTRARLVQAMAVREESSPGGYRRSVLERKKGANQLP